MIDEQLRFRGWLTDLFLKSRDETKYRSRAHKMKKTLRLLAGRSIKGLDCREVQVPRTGGGTVRVRLYQPLNHSAPLPVIVWLHGGGYAIGVPEQDHAMFQQFMTASPCVIVAPDYRLSVEAPYPAALEDCYDTLLWTKNHAEKLGINRNKLIVAGSSAGGGLTAALCLLARDRGEVNIAFQMPLYPMIDDRMTTESARNNQAPVWDSNMNLWGWRLYLGDRFGGEVPAYAAAARATDYRNLPPMATFVGDLEPFRDETLHYVENLRQAGVRVDFQLFPGCYHGFDVVCPDAEVSKRAMEFLMSAYIRAVE